MPKTNKEFWLQKFEANRQRDARAIWSLRRAGYRIVMVWECETRDPFVLFLRLSKIFKSGRVGVRKSIDH